MVITVFAAIVLLTGAVAVAATDLRILAVIPAIMVAYLTIHDFRLIYLMMWALVPLSTELELAGGMGLDFPVELVMVLLTGCFFFWLLSHGPKLSFALLYHPLTICLILHLGWIAIATMYSVSHVVSVKFFLAKIWYIIPFYVMSYLLLRSERDIRAWFFWVLLPMLLTVVIILIRHGMESFTFASVNSVLNPFYRNHVDYALTLGVFFPFVVYLTFTRAAYLGLIVAAAGYFIIRWRLVRYMFIAALLAGGIMLASLWKDYRYIDYAPDYYRTITHYKFDRLIEATYKMEDISSMERLYRWIAGVYMVKERPLTGYGPNNFYISYKPFADTHFETYVSDNPDRSGIHNYFLMLAVEQGIPGMIIFALLMLIALLRAEWLFRHLREGFYRKLLCGVTGSLFFILFALLLNDMIETDKVGSFFFLNLALIAVIERNARREGSLRPTEKTESQDNVE